MIRKIICVTLTVLLIFCPSVSANEGSEITNFTVSAGDKVYDGKINTYTTCESVTLKSNRAVKYLYLTFWEKASDITSYSPCEFGLYYSSVGADITGGDMFENIKTYAEIEEEQNTLYPEAEIKNPAFETKPKNDYTAYYILAACVLTVIIAVILIVIRKKR